MAKLAPIRWVLAALEDDEMSHFRGNAGICFSGNHIRLVARASLYYFVDLRLRLSLRLAPDLHLHKTYDGERI